MELRKIVYLTFQDIIEDTTQESKIEEGHKVSMSVGLGTSMLL